MAYNQERGFSQSGVWVPVDGSGAGLVFSDTVGNCTWVRNGELMTLTFKITYPVTANGANVWIDGFPVPAFLHADNVGGGAIGLNNTGLNLRYLIQSGGTGVFLFGATSFAQIVNSQLSGAQIRGHFIYQIAVGF